MSKLSGNHVRMHFWLYVPSALLSNRAKIRIFQENEQKNIQQVLHFSWTLLKLIETDRIHRPKTKLGHNLLLWQMQTDFKRAK